jgi:hypothetical protein
MHICVNIMFPLVFCDVKVVSCIQVLTGTTSLNKSLKILFILSNSDTPNDGKTEATRLLGVFFFKFGFYVSKKIKLVNCK